MSTRDVERRVTLEAERFGDDVVDTMKRWTDKWWVFVVAGVLWLVVALVVLRFDTTSSATIGALMGIVFIVSAAEEFFVAYIRRGWRWAHVLLGILFLAGAVYCFVRPIDAFWSLAAVFGLLLILRGSLDVVSSTMSSAINPIWGLGLVVGILEILLGFWASQQVVEVRAALLVVWIGFFLTLRAMQLIVIGFEIRSAGRQLTRALGSSTDGNGRSATTTDVS